MASGVTSHMATYLKNHSLRHRAERGMSNRVKLPRALFQGFILGQVVFLKYVNYLGKKSSSLRFPFVDDLKTL